MYAISSQTKKHPQNVFQNSSLISQSYLLYGVIQNLRPPSGAASTRLSENLTRVGRNKFSLNIICQISWSRSLRIGLQPLFKKKSERCHFSRTMAFFHKNRGFLINYLYVLCSRMINIHSQIKSKPILERRMMALVNERHILILACKL